MTTKPETAMFQKLAFTMFSIVDATLARAFYPNAAAADRTSTGTASRQETVA